MTDKYSNSRYFYLMKEVVNYLIKNKNYFLPILKIFGIYYAYTLARNKFYFL